MNVYKYDEITKEYLGIETAHLNPLETEIQGKEVYLLPANATFDMPYPVKTGYAQVYIDGVWNYVEDNRGKEYWLDTDEYGTPARTMKELGAFPANAIFKAPQKPFDILKQEKLREAGSLFAQKRDAIRFIQLDETRKYGFDCANEDVTNFMASYMPLLIMRGGTTEYKVYLDETNLDNKKLVELSFEDMHKTYSEVSTDQKKAYKWYEVVKAQVNACTTKEELEAIVW